MAALVIDLGPRAQDALHAIRQRAQHHLEMLPGVLAVALVADTTVHVHTHAYLVVDPDADLADLETRATRYLRSVGMDSSVSLHIRPGD